LVFSPKHLAERLMPYPLPTTDGGVLRTIGDARGYMLALSKEREWLNHWKPAYRLQGRPPPPKSPRASLTPRLALLTC
jgi:hypothetical protein